MIIYYYYVEVTCMMLWRTAYEVFWFNRSRDEPK